MPAPILDAVAGELYDQVSPLAYADDRYGYPLAHLCAVAGGLLQEIDDLVRDDGIVPGWGKLLDVDLAPGSALPYLGQFIGVTVDTSKTLPVQRDQIRSPQGFARGTRQAIVAAVQQYLTGTKNVTLVERAGGDAYAFTVITRLTETPPADLASTNLLPNGGFETNLLSNATPYAPTSGIGTITRDNAHALFGSWALKYVGTGALAEGPALADPAIPIVAGTPYTMSAWVYSAAGGEQLGLDMFWYTPAFAVNTGVTSSPTMTLSAGWNRIIATGTPPATSTLVSFRIAARAAVAYTYWVDGWQLETGSVATPYIETNGAPASRPIGQGPVGAALAAAKPAGLRMTFTVVAGQTFAQLKANYATFAAVTSHYSTLAGVRDDVP